MMKYRFTLKDNKEKPYRLFSWFLFFMHLVAAGVFALKATTYLERLSLIILLVFYVAIYIVYSFCRNRGKAFETFSLILSLLYINFWFKHVSVIAGIIAVVVCLFIALVHVKKTTVLFSDEGVHLTRVFKTVVFPWIAMENVILKDGLLTIDFKTNRIIQLEIAETNIAVDETEFNLFCTGLLKKVP
jgi:uncharacterized membrane protein YobD (UPF0266 family)